MAGCQGPREPSVLTPAENPAFVCSCVFNRDQRSAHAACPVVTSLNTAAWKSEKALKPLESWSDRGTCRERPKLIFPVTSFLNLREENDNKEQKTCLHFYHFIHCPTLWSFRFRWTGIISFSVIKLHWCRVSLHGVVQIISDVTEISVRWLDDGWTMDWYVDW